MAANSYPWIFALGGILMRMALRGVRRGAVVVALLVAATACGNGVGRAGPLNLGPVGSEAGGTRDVGAVISFGVSLLKHEGNEDALITKVSLNSEQEAPGVTVTAVYVVDITGAHEISALADEFPPANEASLTFVPAEGATLVPGQTYQMMFVLRVDRPGEWFFPSYDLEYEVMPLRYSDTGGTGLRICAPAGVACGTMPVHST